MRASFARRVRIIAAVIVIVALVLIGRLYMLSIMQGGEYRDRADAQYAHATDSLFDRGKIFFTPKEGPPLGAATLASGYIVAVLPSQITNAETAYERLSKRLTVDRTTFLAKARKEGDPYEELAPRVEASVGAALQKDAIPGIGVYPVRWRTYPGGETAAQTIGFMGYNTDGTTQSGQYGLERFYDAVLQRAESGPAVNFFTELFSSVRNRLAGSGARPGADVMTSIEPTVQAFAENTLDAYDSEWNPQSSGVIIMVPSTGEITAMAARPIFDPNNLADADPDALANPLTERVYEFGSIMKAITMAAGLDAGVVTPSSTYTDKGYAVYDGSKIQNYDGKARGGGTTMQQVLDQSLNTGAAYVAVDRLGSAKFREYFDKFGLRSATGIDLPSEALPLTSNLESPRSIEYATASYGQGFAVTAVSMARALATLANHGMVPSPHIATELRYPGEPAHTLSFPAQTRAISPEAADTLTRMLVSVVDTSLRDGKVKIPELSVAAKTGTAQIADQAAHTYYQDRYLHSFFGYFPAYDPKFLVFFYAVAPQGAKYASETWTDPFIRSVKFLMSYYSIEPDRAPTAQSGR